MSKPNEMLTTRRFAEQAGVTPSTVSKWLRDGKIAGQKQGGTWQVPADQLAVVAAAASASESDTAPAPTKSKHPSAPAATTAGGHKDFSVEAFAELTYLTVAGVQRWLKEGRLQGSQDANGNWRVDGNNLVREAFQRLVRK